jgi:DNA-binding transcriptional ArsR family regulator
MDLFAVLAAPSRRQILAELGRSASSVNELAETLSVNQPTISKHLKVLREAGFVSCRGEGQQHIYQLERAPFEELDSWLEPYLRLWSRHLNALERYLDSKESTDEAKRVSPRTHRGSRRPDRR